MATSPESTPDHALTALDLGLCAAVFVVTLVALLATMDVGIPRDESFYFHAARLYVKWFEDLAVNWEAGKLSASFTQAGIDRHFSYNPEHPALPKILFGLGLKLFHQKLEWADPIVAMRLPAVLFAGLLSSVTYLFGRDLFGRAAGLLAVAALLLQPRYFFHAHLACFDVPVIAMWCLVAYAYWRSLRSPRWAIVAGIGWGIGLSLKLNAFFMPAVLGLHWVWFRRRALLPGRVDGKLRFGRPPIPWAFVSMLVFGPLLFFGLWPRHWYETFDRLGWYLSFHLKHVHYFVYYFGERIQQPPLPISFPWVMTLITVPATILLGALAGALLFGRRSHADGDDRAPGVLLWILIIFPIALISAPNTPIFGGTKHWMAAMPFVAILCGGALVALGGSLADWLRSEGASSTARGISTACVAACCLAPAAMASVEAHPFGTSYYNELIGSYRGAADARMMRQFWGYAGRQGLPWLSENAPQNARVWTHNTTSYAWREYKGSGLVREDLRPTSATGSQYAMYHHQKAFVYMLTDVWDSYGTRTPAHVVGVDGVPVLSVYERPGLR